MKLQQMNEVEHQDSLNVCLQKREEKMFMGKE